MALKPAVADIGMPTKMFTFLSAPLKSTASQRVKKKSEKNTLAFKHTADGENTCGGQLSYDIIWKHAREENQSHLAAKAEKRLHLEEKSVLFGVQRTCEHLLYLVMRKP